MKNTTDKVAHFAQDAADSLSNAGHQARVAFDETGEQLLHAEQHAVKNCRGYVRTNPLTSLSIAVVAGFFIGGLLGITRR